jgi:hypothetical protein
MVFFISGVREPYIPSSHTTRFLKFSLILPAVREPLIERMISHLLFDVDSPKGLKELVVVADDEQTCRIALRFQQLYPTPANTFCPFSSNLIPFHGIGTFSSGQLVSLSAFLTLSGSIDRAGGGSKGGIGVRV